MVAAIVAGRKPTEIDLEALQRSESEGLLGSLVAQRARLQTHADMALELGDIKAATSVERAITSNLELVAKLLGQLIVRHQTTHTSVLLTEDYLTLRRVLVEVLRKHPAARIDVARALHELEMQAAKDISERKAPLAPLIEHQGGDHATP